MFYSDSCESKYQPEKDSRSQPWHQMTKEPKPTKYFVAEGSSDSATQNAQAKWMLNKYTSRGMVSGMVSEKCEGPSGRLVLVNPCSIL